MKLTFAYWGNYTIPFKTFFEGLGLEVIPPEKTNLKAIEEGAKLSPELFCFPFKVNIGNYLTAINRGADTIFMWENIGGSCRLRYYWIVQEKVLREANFKVNVLNINARNFFSKINKIRRKNKISVWQLIKNFRFFFSQIRFIEKLEERARYLRPREKENGRTDQILIEILEKMKKIKKMGDLKNLEKEVWKKNSQIEIDENRKVFKIGLVGEIYTVVDGAINFDLERKLGKMGVEVHRQMNLFYHFKKTIFPWIDWFLQRKINPYLRSTVGGHGRDAIYETLEFAKKGFDGVIQLLPFGCFIKDTNITVGGYLQKPIQEIEIGEKVLTHKGRFKKVTQTFCRNYKGKILKIDCGGKLNLSITLEHPILLAKTFIKNHKKRIQNFDFIPAIEAKVGDFIAIPIPKKIKNKDSLRWSKKYERKPKWEDIKKFPYSPELLRMLGYWLAEGSIHYDIGKYKNKKYNKKYLRGIRFSFSVNEKNYINDVINIIKKNFKTKISQFHYPEKPTNLDLYIGNRNLADVVHYLCAEHCDGKSLHKDLVVLEPNLQKEILKGFFRGDGCFRDEYGETNYVGATTSWNLASQLFWLLIRNCIKASFMERHHSNRKLSWVLKIANAQGIKRLGDELIKVTNRKNYVRFRELKDYFLVPIRKIEAIDFRGKVYNLEVEDDHSYVANFLAAHNCMPEVTVRPILQKISQEKGIPFLSFSIDEQTGEAGVQTRLEAFMDLLWSRQKKKL